MRSGRLRHRVKIEQAVAGQSASGQQTTAGWVTFAEVWAAVDPLRGREYFAAAERQADVSHRVTIRHLDGVLPTMRIKLADGRVLDIQSVLNIEERDREIQLMCRERVQQ